MSGEPVGEDGIWGFRVVIFKFLHADARWSQSLLEIVKLSLGLEGSDSVTEEILDFLNKVMGLTISLVSSILRSVECMNLLST